MITTRKSLVRMSKEDKLEINDVLSWVFSSTDIDNENEVDLRYAAEFISKHLGFKDFEEFYSVFREIKK